MYYNIEKVFGIIKKKMALFDLGLCFFIFHIKTSKMEDLNKRPYSRCMYGNYKMDTLEAKSGSEGLKSGSKWIFAAAAIIILGIIIGFIGCKPKQVVAEKEKLVYVTKDSIVHRDSTVYVPVEVYKDYALDTLVLRTSLAESKSWLDTGSLYLVGEIRNLKALHVKYVEVDKWHTKDSLVYKEVPVPYPVVEKERYIPKWSWITLLISIGVLGYGGWKLYKRLKPI